ncbi:MAG: B12-binding domain-containing radical SAM protein [Deltaproteobacteria bacterium]|nr:B12-binding domain-containing radical SAM protein [Deltaproteobacteria bacterium]
MADDLDALPLPAQDLLNPELYDSVITDAHPVTTMVTSRGCPFQCRFCSQSITGKSYRFHSPERVLEEIKGCMDLGYRGILFYDEVFTIRRKRVIELCTLIQKERMRFDWMARGTINTVDGDLMRAMHDAGCRTITFGVESGSERILKRMNRPVRDTKKIAKVFRDAKAAGLTSLAYMMLGNPDETVEDMKATRAMLRAINPDHVHISVFVAYPATEFYREGVERGLFSSDVWRGFAANPAEAFRVPTWPEAPPAETLFAEARRLYRTHYFRPHNIWRHLRAAGGLRGIRKRLPYLQALLRLRRAPAAG